MVHDLNTNIRQEKKYVRMRSDLIGCPPHTINTIILPFPNISPHYDPQNISELESLDHYLTLIPPSDKTLVEEPRKVKMLYFSLVLNFSYPILEVLSYILWERAEPEHEYHLTKWEPFKYPIVEFPKASDIGYFLTVLLGRCIKRKIRFPAMIRFSAN